jgi:hypothetical protein
MVLAELNNLIIPPSLKKVDFYTVQEDYSLVSDPYNGAFFNCRKLPMETQQRL